MIVDASSVSAINWVDIKSLSPIYICYFFVLTTAVRKTIEVRGLLFSLLPASASVLGILSLY